MTLESLKSTLVSVEKVPPDFVFVNFEVVREEWNRYRLEDETILKAKFVLTSIMMEKNYKEIMERAKTEKGLKMRCGFNSRSVIGVEAPVRLRGDPDIKTYTIEELRASIAKEDIDFEPLKETWNAYKLENGITIKVRNAPISVSRTSKFDSLGLPIYLVDWTADVKVALPKK
jgi:hypothetical protein